ncbi:hypothetical protein QBC43DRAFT_110160 [Cladorrhinum sp. PSN259]|nr:hypothetical protein QBC43DRAFT_110160 [Cladorrhinum sp. PSN259]
MSSFGNNRLSSSGGGRQLRVPERLRHSKNSSSFESAMEDIIYNHPSLLAQKDFGSSDHQLQIAGGPTDTGSLLDYFDLPSPPSTPMNPTHFSSMNDAFPGAGPSSPGLSTSSVSSCSSFSSPPSSPSLNGHHWPTASQRISRLPVRPRFSSSNSHSRSSSTSSSSSAFGADTLADGIESLSVSGTPTQQPGITVRAARRTPYYPPNSSRTRGDGERSRVFMNRGPHYVPNWTPLSSLPRHVQLQIEERMVRFTAI